MHPQTAKSFFDELTKIAKGLRERIELIPEVVAGGRAAGKGEQIRWQMMLEGKPIGLIETKGRQVSISHLDPKFRGMGLGRKMYGEVMRRMPAQTMESDTWLSDKGKAVWESMKSRGSATVTKPLNLSYRQPGSLQINGSVEPTTFNTALLGPHYRATLPAAAAVDTGKSILPTGRERLSRVGRGALGAASLVGMGALYTSPFWAPSVIDHFVKKKREASSS